MLNSTRIIFAAMFVLFFSSIAQAQQARMVMVSDIHFNPFHDPAKVDELASAPLEKWESILSRGETPSQPQAFEDLRKNCKLRGIDTPYAHFASTIKAIHLEAVDAKFITLTGDLLAHTFDCMYHATQPQGTPQQYMEFSAKTMGYVMQQLLQAAPMAKLYFAIGNNDSGCGDYRLDMDDPWFRMTAKIPAQRLGKTWTAAASTSFTHAGYFNVVMPAPMQKTRIISINDVFYSAGYKNCNKAPDAEPAKEETVWLKKQFNDARAKHEKIWIMGHLPFGAAHYATFVQQAKTKNLCTAEGKPSTYFPDETLSTLLLENADLIQLALFGHTHVDEWKVIEAEKGAFPLKITPAVTSIGGNLPSFTVATIDTRTSQIADYTVFSAPDKEGTSFAKEYTFSETYGRKGFVPASLRSIINDLHKDTTLSTDMSQLYIKNWSVGAIRNQIQPYWSAYVCSMDKPSPDAYKECVCSGPLGETLKEKTTAKGD